MQRYRVDAIVASTPENVTYLSDEEYSAWTAEHNKKLQAAK